MQLRNSEFMKGMKGMKKDFSFDDDDYEYFFRC